MAEKEDADMSKELATMLMETGRIGPGRGAKAEAILSRAKEALAGMDYAPWAKGQASRRGASGGLGPAIRYVAGKGVGKGSYLIRGLDPLGWPWDGPEAGMAFRIGSEDLLRLIDADGLDDEELNRLHYSDWGRGLLELERGDLDDDTLWGASLIQACCRLTKEALADAQRWAKARKKGLRATPWMPLSIRRRGS